MSNLEKLLMATPSHRREFLEAGCRADFSLQPREECGVFGIFNHDDASSLTYLGLYALQHRGQESTGIVTCDQGEPMSHRGMGLVVDTFDPAKLKALSGTAAVGHVRYSTTGSSLLKNAQPFLAQHSQGFLAIVHN